MTAPSSAPVPPRRSAFQGLVISVIALFLISPLGAETETATTAPTTSKSGLDRATIAEEVLATMDRSADPCQDFYRYACGGWLDSTTLPADQSRWARSFSVVQERNQETLRLIIEEAAAHPGQNPDKQRVGTFYNACMDEAAIAELALKPVKPWLEEIEQIDDLKALMTVTGRQHKVGLETFFETFVYPDFKDPERNIAHFSQGGLGLPHRDYYLTDDEEKRGLRQDYVAHIAGMLELIGEDAENAAQAAAAILAFETELAKTSRSQTEMRDFDNLYHKLDRQGLEGLAGKLPWGAYLQAIGDADLVSINVLTPEHFTTLDRLLSTTELDVLRTYLRWHLVHGVAAYLPAPFVDAHFAFFGRRLAGQQEQRPRWKRCVNATQAAFGETVGRLYVERTFSGDSKEIALTMIHDIEAAFADNLAALPWMDEATRGRALEKMRAVGNKIGYPDAWREEGPTEVFGGAYLANVLAAAEVEFARELGKVDQEVDRDEWGMLPQTVNAYYNPLANEMVFPAGILQPPFFHRDFPAAMRYGGIGAAMGHELTHGFDDQGRKFDPAGRLQEWWDPAVSQRFEKEAQCVDDFYSGMTIEEGLNIDGKLTLGENLADIGGLKQAYKAFQRWRKRQEEPADRTAVSGLSDDQLFFVAYAQTWCALIRPEIARVLARTDSHAPPRFRVSGPLANIPAFGEAFECAPGTPLRPKEVCLVW